MDKTIYKTSPRLIISSMTWLGFIFFGLLFWLTKSGITDDYNTAVITVMVVFAGLSLICLFYFVSIKTLKLTTDSFEIKWLLLPFRQAYSLNDISSITQTKKAISAVYGVAWTSRYIYTDITTIINLTDKRTIKINSVGELDFEELRKVFEKLKRGEGKVKVQRKNIMLYLLDNIDGLFWVILLIILTTGLAYGLLTRS